MFDFISHYIDIFCNLVSANPISFLLIFVTSTVLLNKYFSGGVCHIKKNLSSKVVIVTGASTGIGQFTTQELAKMGATVVMACRDLPKSEQAKAAILKSVQNPGNLKIDLMYLDLADLKSVRDFAKAFKEKYSRLDILINNAGVMALPTRKITKDGFEMQIGTNHLGHFLLTNLLLDTLKASKPSRIVNLASLAHNYGYLNLDDINSEKFYNSQTTYGASKLANIMFTKELAKRLEGTDVKVVCLHPGVVRTELMRYMYENILLKIGLTIMWPVYCVFTKNVEQGAQTSLYCALEDHEKLINGQYYSDCKPKKPRSDAENNEKMMKLWTISEKLVKL